LNHERLERSEAVELLERLERLDPVKSEAVKLLKRLERTAPPGSYRDNSFSSLFTIRQDAIASQPDDGYL
jgi:hypothetical protein